MMLSTKPVLEKNFITDQRPSTFLYPNTQALIPEMTRYQELPPREENISVLYHTRLRARKTTKHSHRNGAVTMTRYNRKCLPVLSALITPVRSLR